MGFYKILGVEKSANEDEIKKAYRKRGKTMRPSLKRLEKHMPY